MPEKVEVKLAHGTDEGQPGDKVAVDADRARTLVRGGYATYATKTAAKAAEGAAATTSGK